MAEIETIVDLNALKSDEDKKTDQFGGYINPEPAFMTIDIKVPEVGGDAAGGSARDVGMSTLKGAFGAVESAAAGAGLLGENQLGLNFDSPADGGGQTDGDAGSNTTIAETAPTAAGGEITDGQPGVRNQTNVNSPTQVSVALPMPLELSYEDGANWADDTSAATDIATGVLAQAANVGGGSVFGKFMNGLSAVSVLAAGRKIAQKEFNVGLEPRKEIYYGGPVFREFTFTWEFSPKNAQEANRIKNAVKLLRKYSYPDRASDTLSALGLEVWKLPATYIITFNLGSKVNPHIPRIKNSVVKSITFNPTKEGYWRQFQDGHPVSSSLSITFQEVEVLTRKDFEDGNGASF